MVIANWEVECILRAKTARSPVKMGWGARRESYALNEAKAEVAKPNKPDCDNHASRLDGVSKGILKHVLTESWLKRSCQSP